MKFDFLLSVLRPLYLILFSILINFSFGYAQLHSSIIDSLNEKMQWYKQAKSPDLLFVHFDKTIYGNGEHAWFSGYLLKSETDINSHNTLSVALVRDDDRSVVAENRFVMQNAISSGDITLPDTIPPGNYHFIAYTNVTRSGYPDAIFTQPITVKTNDPSFFANLILTDSLTSKNDTARVKVKVTTNEFVNMPKVDVSYSIGDADPTAHVQRLQTNKYGEAFISVPFQHVVAGYNVLHVQVKSGFLFKELILRIPVLNKEARVKFYPEGGNLVEKTSRNIGWEVKNNEGEPLQVSGILYENEKVIDTIQTNESGFGKFMIKAVRNSNYRVRVLYAYSKDTIYSLPPVLGVMPAISVLKAVAGDTLGLIIQNMDKIHSRSFLLIHNYKQIFLAYSVNNSQASSEFKKIPLDKVPKGLATITLIDSAGKPLAERMFFAHFDQRADIIINTDSAQYLTRQKVQLTLKLNNKGKPVNGIVSVACVQNNRLDFRKMNDIESYTYVYHQLEDVSFRHNMLSTSAEDNEYMEDVLLIKGWRRYKWMDMLGAKATDTLQSRELATFKGSVTRYTKPVNKETELSLINDSVLHTITTNKLGNFELLPAALVVPPEKEIMLFINQKNQSLYKLSMTDPFESVNEKLAKKMRFENYDIKTNGENTDTVLLKRYQNQMILAPVTVKSKKGYTDIFAGTLRVYEGKCSDFVCSNGILNCPNHRINPVGRGFEINMNVKPITGQQYVRVGEFNQPEEIIYKGNCDEVKVTNDFTLAIKGIYAAKEFYNEDYSKVPLAEPSYLSTIYWKASLPINTESDTKLSFYTSDITGRFRIVVQGITTGDVIYGQYLFSVKGK